MHANVSYEYSLHLVRYEHVSKIVPMYRNSFLCLCTKHSEVNVNYVQQFHNVPGTFTWTRRCTDRQIKTECIDVFRISWKMLHMLKKSNQDELHQFSFSIMFVIVLQSKKKIDIIPKFVNIYFLLNVLIMNPNHMLFKFSSSLWIEIRLSEVNTVRVPLLKQNIFILHKNIK